MAAFLAQHARYLYLGVTTNESAKWEDVQYALADGELFRYADPATADSAEGINTSSGDAQSPLMICALPLFTSVSILLRRSA
ncbi:hypothetical protein NP569_25170, partial [Vibrio parahaemolyticus]|nr:hypothetical protein [Vibrio parahaemolyticus]